MTKKETAGKDPQPAPGEGERFPATPDGARAATAWARGEGFNVLVTLKGVCA